MTNKMKKKLLYSFIIGAWVFIIVGLCGNLRFYYGSTIKPSIIGKESFSFKDTIVNLDDLLGQPRITIAINHPAVKRQLEEMGIIETDEQIQEKIKREIDADAYRIRRTIEQQVNGR